MAPVGLCSRPRPARWCWQRQCNSRLNGAGTWKLLSCKDPNRQACLPKLKKQANFNGGPAGGRWTRSWVFWAKSLLKRQFICVRRSCRNRTQALQLISSKFSGVFATVTSVGGLARTLTKCWRAAGLIFWSSSDPKCGRRFLVSMSASTASGAFFPYRSLSAVPFMPSRCWYAIIDSESRPAAREAARAHALSSTSHSAA